jgi:O-antigen ligase
MLYIFSKLIAYFIIKGKLKQVIDVITFSLLVNCIFIIYSQSFGNVIGVELHVTDRNSGLIASVNQAGVTSSLAQVFLLYQYLIAPRTKRNRYFLIFGYAIAIYAGFLTFSKAAFINIILNAGIFIYYLRHNFEKNLITRKLLFRNKITITIILITSLLCGFLFSQKIYYNLSNYQKQRIFEFTSLMKGQIDSETTTHRSEIAETAIDLMKEDLFLGRGLGVFHNLEETGGYGTHNEFLLILGEVGFIGFFLYVGYFIFIYINLFKIKFVPNRFLIFTIVNIMLITSMVSHTVLYIKLYVLVFSFVNVLVWYGKMELTKPSVSKPDCSNLLLT